MWIEYHAKAKLTGRKKLGRKMCTSNRDDRKLENTVTQSRFKHLGELHKEWTEAGVSASRVTTLRHLQEKSYYPLLKQKHRRKITGLLLSGPKSSFQIKVNFVFHLETKVWSLEEDWRGTESKLLEVQCEVSEVSDDLGCRDVCWCWSAMLSQVQSQFSRLPGDFEALYAYICWQALWRCWFSFPAGLQHLPTLPKALPTGLLTMILLCLIGQTTCLTWTPSGIHAIFSRERWKIVDPTIQTSWRFNSASAVPQADRFHATPHWCWVCVKGAPTKYCYY